MIYGAADSSGMLISAQLNSDDWFEQLQKLNSAIRITQRNRDQESRPTRIAVLDTGISSDFPGSGNVKGFKDFVNDTSAGYHDSTGHGTSVVRVMLKTYNAAEVYIGRVWERATKTDDTPDLMAQVRN